MTSASHVKKSAAPGALLRMPYGPASIWGRVLHADARGTKVKRGLYLTVLDCDVTDGENLETVARAPRLLGPLQVTAELVQDGTWVVAGEVALTGEELDLPYFEDARGVVDYFGQRVADTPEARARMVQERVMSPETLVAIIRAARGLDTWYPGYNEFRAKKA